MILPNYVTKIISALESAGHEAYAVGGCVRDSLLGLTPSDYDVTTSATPDEVSAVFPRTHDTGVKHGTVTVISDDIPIEVTTFRIDGEYSDNRRPDTVTFTRSLREDLNRRDFTINAMAYSERSGITDYFGGSEDLRNGVIRAVGDPYKRFKEDGLRILRAYRFSAVYGFAIEPETAKAADELRGLIGNISGERIAQELNKLVVAHFGKDKVSSLALFFCDMGYDAARTRAVMRRLKYDNDTFYKVLTLVRYRGIAIKPCKKAVKRVLNRFGAEQFFRLCDFRAAGIAEEVIKSGECYSLKQLAVKGGDLVESGFRGKAVGEALQMLLHAVISEKCANDKEKLLEFMKGRKRK
jgi:tRNA nucleotidyltransferase (CCA-adding enzyme)